MMSAKLATLKIKVFSNEKIMTPNLSPRRHKDSFISDSNCRGGHVTTVW